MGEILTGKSNRKTKKVVGVLIGLSLVQTGATLVPGGNLAMTVYAGDEMTTEEYAQAASAALAELKAGSDKSVLNDLISQVTALDVSSSDEASVAQLQAVLNAANQVSANANASQSMVDKLILLLQSAGNALYQKTDANTVYDGVYELSGSLQHASADQYSMGNAALVKPFQLIKDGDSLKLRIECVPLTTKLGSKNFTGYLAEFWYFPDWTDEIFPPSAGTAVQSAETEEADPVEIAEADTEEVGIAENTDEEAEDAGDAEVTGEDSVDLFSDSSEDAGAAAVTQDTVVYAGNAGGIAAEVESTYDGYDGYNDPNTGSDATVKGKLYPHYITIPIDLNRSLLWTQVYVPVMESISTGGGRQYARLILDWSSLKQISGTKTDKSALVSGISEAETLLNNLNADNQGYAAEQIQALGAVITAAKAVNTNLNVDQEIVDNETKTLTSAVNVFTKNVVSDKTELKKAIEVADTYLNADDVVYGPDTLAILQEARDRAQEVYDDEEASQTQVNLCVTAIDNAIQGLVITGGDRRELKKAMTTASEMLKNADVYTASDYRRLQSAYDKAKAAWDNADAEQAEIDDCAENLNYVIKNMKKTTDVKVDKSSLYEMLKTAQNMSGREDQYTADSIKALKKVIEAAEKVYQDDGAAQSDVNTQTSALSTAIMNLTVKPSSSNTGNGNSNSSNGSSDDTITTVDPSDSDSGSDSTTDSGSKTLDINNLEDGVYSLTGSMVKTDKSTASMSNEAINHTIKLTVKSGKYYLTMDFKGMTINEQYGYLGKLKYFKTGYTLDKYGSPQGSLGDVTIDSYQKYSDGKKVSDSFGTDYPDVVTFPMISEALKDGYVPLQVFVPIMDSISKGTGTQPVFLKLDWSTIKSTSSSDSAFKDTTSNEKTSTGSSTNKTSTSGLQNTLKTGTSGGLTTGSKLGTSSLGGNSLGGSSLKTSGTSSLKKTGTTSLTSGKNLKSTKTGETSKTSLKSTAAGMNADGEASTGSGTASAKKSKTAEDVGKVVIPSVLSSLAALAGIFYKLKSRLGIR